MVLTREVGESPNLELEAAQKGYTDAFGDLLRSRITSQPPKQTIGAFEKVGYSHVFRIPVIDASGANLIDPALEQEIRQQDSEFSPEEIDFEPTAILLRESSKKTIIFDLQEKTGITPEIVRGFTQILRRTMGNLNYPIRNEPIRPPRQAVNLPLF